MGIKLEKIIIKISSGEIEKIEAIMDKMALIPSVEMSPLSYGQHGNDIIANFDIDDGHFAMMVEKLYSANLNVLPTNDKVSQVLEFLYGKYGKKTFSKTALPQGSVSAPTQEIIDDCRNNGRYEDLIKIIKLVSIDPILKNNAKNSIPEAVKKNIDQNYNSVFINKHAIPSSIAALIKICSDVNLKTLNLQPLQKEAGLSAIAICENYLEYLDELIKISNNNQIPSVINVKAAVKFWEIVSKNIEKYPADTAAALKSTNFRFLENAFDIAQSEFSDTEKSYFDSFKNYIVSNKK